MLHFKNLFIALQILETNIIMLLKQLLKNLLLIFILLFELIEFICQSFIAGFQLFINWFHFHYLLLFTLYLLLNLSLILFLFFCQLLSKFIRIFPRLIEKIRIFDLKFMTSIIKFKLRSFHWFLMMMLQMVYLFSMSLM